MKYPLKGKYFQLGSCFGIFVPSALVYVVVRFENQGGLWSTADYLRMLFSSPYALAVLIAIVCCLAIARICDLRISEGLGIAYVLVPPLIYLVGLTALMTGFGIIRGLQSEMTLFGVIESVLLSVLIFGLYGIVPAFVIGGIWYLLAYSMYRKEADGD